MKRRTVLMALMLYPPSVAARSSLDTYKDRINMADFPNAGAALNAAYERHAIDDKSTTIYIPSGEYNLDGLTIPGKTSLEGDGVRSRIMGRPIMTSHWGRLNSQVNFVNGLDMANCRSATFLNCHFSGLIHITGSSYYNTFIGCQHRNTSDPNFSAILGEGVVNWNKIYSGRITYGGTALELRGSSNGWVIDATSFEGEAGAGILGPALLLSGSRHVVRDGWFERGNSNTWSPATIVLNADDCHIVRGVRGYSFSVHDNGLGNTY